MAQCSKLIQVVRDFFVGFSQKKVLPQKVFSNLWKYFGHSFFSEFGLQLKFILFAILLHKAHIRENFGPWDMGQNALGKWDCRISKSTISFEQMDEIGRFFALGWKFLNIKSWSKIFE